MVTRSQLEAALLSLYGREWPLSVFQFYSGQDISPDKNILSPLRDNDTAPSMRVFKTDEGDYLAYDYGYSKTYNVFTFVHAYEENRTKVQVDFDYSSVCQIINNDMSLGLDADIFEITIPSEFLELTKREFVKRDPPQICIYPDNWRQCHKDYWAKYYIPIEWLQYFSVYPVYKMLVSWDKSLTWQDKYFYRRKDPAFAYHLIDDDGLEKFKVLRPYSEDYKWFTNVSKQDMSSIQGFKQADLTQSKVYLTSSLKDVIVLRMLGYTAYAFNSESCKPSQKFIEHLKQHHSEVVVFYDNDNAGIVGANKILELDPIFTNAIYIPHEFYFRNGKKVKDPSDYIKYSNGDFDTLKKLIQSQQT